LVLDRWHARRGYVYSSVTRLTVKRDPCSPGLDGYCTRSQKLAS
jgi:hypothetical protein